MKPPTILLLCLMGTANAATVTLSDSAPDPLPFTLLTPGGSAYVGPVPNGYAFDLNADGAPWEYNDRTMVLTFAAPVYEARFHLSNLWQDPGSGLKVYADGVLVLTTPQLVAFASWLSIASDEPFQTVRLWTNVNPWQQEHGEVTDVTARVPEPASVWLLFCGMVLLCVAVDRRGRRG